MSNTKNDDKLCFIKDSDAHVSVHLDFVYLIQRLEILENMKPYYNAS